MFIRVAPFQIIYYQNLERSGHRNCHQGPDQAGQGVDRRPDLGRRSEGGAAEVGGPDVGQVADLGGHLGGKVIMVMTHSESPIASTVPAELHNTVMQIRKEGLYW